MRVKDETNQVNLSPDDLWHRFTLKDQKFPLKYAVYYYFRSSGWIVKCGLKFGCDYSELTGFDFIDIRLFRVRSAL